MCVSDSDSDGEVSRKRRGEPKEVKKRKVAEQANMIVQLSGLKLEVNIHDEDRLAATTLIKWYSKYDTLSNWVEQSGTFDGSKVMRNMHVARLWAGTMNLLITEKAWNKVVTRKTVQVLARRLLALELVSERNNS